MEKRSNLKANIVYNMFYQILLIITPLITSPYVARTIGTDGVGIYSYTYSLASCFAMIGLLGVANYGNRMIASVQIDKEKRSNTFWNVFYVQAVFSILSIFLYLLYVFWSDNGNYTEVLFIQTLTVVCSLFDINWYFFGVEKFKLTVSRNVVIKILNVLLIFLLVKDKADVNIYVFIIAASLLLSNVLIWSFLKDEVYFVKPDLSKMLNHVKPMIILFIPIIAIRLYNSMDKVMIGYLSSVNQNGVYENSEKIINIPKSLITAVGTVMLPRMANLYANRNTESALIYMERTMEFTCILSMAMAFGISAIAKEFAPFFFGTDFSGVGPLLIAISPTIFFVSWANVIRTQYLIPKGKDKVFLISVWMGAISNLIVNSIFIPVYGAMGAVIGTDIAEFVVMFYQTWRVRRELPVGKYIKDNCIYFLIGIIMFCIVRLTSRWGTGRIDTLAVEIAAGAMVYILLGGGFYLKSHNLKLSDLKKLI